MDPILSELAFNQQVQVVSLNSLLSSWADVLFLTAVPVMPEDKVFK